MAVHTDIFDRGRGTVNDLPRPGTRLCSTGTLVVIKEIRRVLGVIRSRSLCPRAAGWNNSGGSCCSSLRPRSGPFAVLGRLALALGWRAPEHSIVWRHSLLAVTGSEAISTMAGQRVRPPVFFAVQTDLYGRAARAIPPPLGGCVMSSCGDNRPRRRASAGLRAVPAFSHIDGLLGV